ncbi:MAG: 50S ribosomal protein L25 [Patescibacteria group bacterium]
MTKSDDSNTKLKLGALKREIFGKKLKKLRFEGKLPGNIFGPDIESQSITVDALDFKRVYRKAKETAVIYITHDKKETPVLVRGVQKHPVSNILLHVDFRKIDLKQKIETKVPVEITGESPAVEQKGGVLITNLNEITIESLPDQIPPSITIDISTLNEIGDEIKISDLPKSDKYTIIDEAEKSIITVTEHKEESLVAETAPSEGPEIIEEKPEGEEVAEGEAPTEDEKGKEEAPKAEGKPEAKSEDKPAENKPEPKKEEK